MEFARIARRTLGASAVTLTTAVALLAMTAPASAHIKTTTASCNSENKAELFVKLVRYDGSKTNTVKIKDGQNSLDDKKFSDFYERRFTLPGNVAHTFTIEVKAGDDPHGYNGWSFTKKLETPPCVTPTTTTSKSTTTTTAATTTTTTTNATTTTTTTEPTAPSEATTTTTTPSLSLPTTTTTKAFVPVGNESELPNTGASIVIPLAVGLGLLGAGGVALLALRRRRAAE